MRKTTKIRKRIFALCLALMAFLAMPLTAGAFQSTLGNMGGYGVRGAVYIYDTHAYALTECQYSMACTTVDLKYYCANEDDGMIKIIPSYGSTNTVAYRPNSRYRSYKAVSTHHVSFGTYQWNPAPISTYYL